MLSLETRTVNFVSRNFKGSITSTDNCKNT